MVTVRVVHLDDQEDPILDMDFPGLPSKGDRVKVNGFPYVVEDREWSMTPQKFRVAVCTLWLTRVR